MSGYSQLLVPTFTNGWLPSTVEALILLEGVLENIIPAVTRRPYDRERAQMIQSGYIFIYAEQTSNIKRWTDGVFWSPSRIKDNFLVYRELIDSMEPGKKRRVNRRTLVNGVAASFQTSSNASSPIGVAVNLKGTIHGRRISAYERNLYGSLIDSYDFKPDGLMKKTICLKFQGLDYHVISYYRPADVVAGALRVPSDDERLKHLYPRSELIEGNVFRAPIEPELPLADITAEQFQSPGMPDPGPMAGFQGRNCSYDSQYQMSSSPYPSSPVPWGFSQHKSVADQATTAYVQVHMDQQPIVYSPMGQQPVSSFTSDNQVQMDQQAMNGFAPNNQVQMGLEPMSGYAPNNDSPMSQQRFNSFAMNGGQMYQSPQIPGPGRFQQQQQQQSAFNAGQSVSFSNGQSSQPSFDSPRRMPGLKPDGEFLKRQQSGSLVREEDERERGSAFDLKAEDSSFPREEDDDECFRTVTP